MVICELFCIFASRKPTFMIQNAPSLDLVEFIETKILPQYAAFDAAHNMEHVTRVIRHSLELVKITGADINMVYTIAAYHDLGMSGPRAVHHLTGGKILASDARLRKWFSPEQLKVMREAVEDHRASASRSPRSIYGKIVAEADRDLDTDIVIRRTIQFGLERRLHQTLDSELPERQAPERPPQPHRPARRTSQSVRQDLPRNSLRQRITRI